MRSNRWHGQSRETDPDRVDCAGARRAGGLSDAVRSGRPAMAHCRLAAAKVASTSQCRRPMPRSDPDRDRPRPRDREIEIDLEIEIEIDLDLERDRDRS